MKRPEESEYHPYFKSYIDSIETDDILGFLSNQIDELSILILSLTEPEANYSYAEGKWTIKQLLGHIVDCERISGYRTMCIARGEKISLPGFDQNGYVINGNFSKRDLKSMVEEFTLLRKSLLILSGNLDDDALRRSGFSNNKELTAGSLLFIIGGHAKHHLDILKEKYLGIK